MLIFDPQNRNNSKLREANKLLPPSSEHVHRPEQVSAKHIKSINHNFQLEKLETADTSSNARALFNMGKSLQSKGR